MVRGWFGVRGRDWRTQSPDRFVIHIISELTIEHVGITLTANPRLVPELYPHMAEPVCQRCGALGDCDHLSRELHHSPQQTSASSDASSTNGNCRPRGYDACRNADQSR